MPKVRATHYLRMTMKDGRIYDSGRPYSLREATRRYNDIHKSPLFKSVEIIPLKVN